MCGCFIWALRLGGGWCGRDYHKKLYSAKIACENNRPTYPRYHYRSPNHKPLWPSSRTMSDDKVHMNDFGRSFSKTEVETFRNQARFRHWRRICGEEELDDPWPLNWMQDHQAFQRQQSRPFHVQPEAFLFAASKKPPVRREATVSAFAHWVHSLYAPESSATTLHEAKLSEVEIFALRSRRGRWVMNLTELPTGSGWKLEHCGLMTNPNIDRSTSANSRAYAITTLSVDGQPLRASPDLVFVNTATNEAVIVEIKFSNKPLPTNLWPDLWAQLWAYSKIPQFAKCSKISVVGEVWGDYDDFDARMRVLKMRKVLRRDPRNPAFERFFSRLFKIYSCET